MLPAVHRTVDAALLLRPRRASQRARKYNVGIRAVNEDSPDTPGLLQTHVRPGFPGVRRFANSITDHIASRMTQASPVPAHTTLGSLGATARDPIAATGCLSNIGAQRLPPSVDFHTPPTPLPHSTCLDLRALPPRTRCGFPRAAPQIESEIDCLPRIRFRLPGLRSRKTAQAHQQREKELSASHERHVCLHKKGNRKQWCRRGESNPRPRDYETLALPLSYAGTEQFLMLEAGRKCVKHSREEWNAPD